MTTKPNERDPVQIELGMDQNSRMSSRLDKGRSQAYFTCAHMRNRVRDLRMARNLSQGELAAKLNVSRQTVNAIETEKYTPSLPLALALARFFGTSVES